MLEGKLYRPPLQVSGVLRLWFMCRLLRGGRHKHTTHNRPSNAMYPNPFRLWYALNHPPIARQLTFVHFSEVYYGGEALTSLEMPQSYTCPYCAKMGFTDTTLQEHVTAEHQDTSFEVVRLKISPKNNKISTNFPIRCVRYAPRCQAAIQISWLTTSPAI